MARTHLIMPLIQAIPGVVTPLAPVVEKTQEGSGGGGGGGGDGGNDGDPGAKSSSTSMGMTEVKAKYVATLIALFEEKASKGEMDEKLMERIERLIGAQ